MIDLHMHSRYSDDGEFTPSELIEQCAEKGVRMVSIADHNCAKANEEAAGAAKKKGMLYIPGIEIDCTYRGTDRISAIKACGPLLSALQERRRWVLRTSRRPICRNYPKAAIGRGTGRVKCSRRFCSQCRSTRTIPF